MSEPKTIRIMPLPKVHPKWEHDWSDYPEILKVSFSNGKIRTYVLKEDIPSPQVVSAGYISKIFAENTYGGYKPKHIKK